MSFSYNPSESTDKDKVRGQIGDTIEKNGPRPHSDQGINSNYADEVITATITREVTWERAVANMFERLAAEWSKEATFSASGGGQSNSQQYSNVAAEFRKNAETWRKRYGYVEDDDTVTEGVSVGVLRLGFQAVNSPS